MIRNMMTESISWQQIQKVTGRSSATLSRVLGTSGGQKKKAKGAPVKATKKVASKILKSATSLVKRANAQEEVTAAMIKAHAKVDICEKLVREQLHSQNIRFLIS